MKKVFNLLLLASFCGNIEAQTPPMGDSTFIYRPDGTKEWFWYQRDVAVFRYSGGVAYTATLPPLVTSIKWDNTDPHGYNIITWDSSATNAQIDIQNAYMAGDPNLEYGFIPCTKDKYASASENKWYMGSDLINIRFKGSEVEADFLDQFVTRNGLSLYHRPESSLPNADTWTWVFRLSRTDAFLPYEACARIWFNEQTYISHCEPDMGIYRAADCVVPSEVGVWNGTLHPDALWYIKNNGNTVYSGFGSGVAGADAKLCECWGDGYTGSRIKVAVIDGGGYDYTHPDMAGQYLTGYDFVNMTSFSASHYVNNTDPHGMEVASVIAAIPNGGMVSGQSINATAVGAAYDCKIIPYITNIQSNTQIGMAIQQAVSDGADVVNMSFSGAYTPGQYAATTVYADIQAAVSTGRSGLGIVFCAATGNDNANGLYYPAAMNEVIGVGATDPNDYRGSYLQTNPWTWQNLVNIKGSNYYTMPGGGNSDHYDVMAPGTAVRVAFTQNPQTNPVQTSIAGTGTSFASPIVAGIAAMILEKYPSTPYQQVASMINFTADKVRSGTGGTTPYNYSVYSNVPGYASETFYGRVNCHESINNPTAGLKENSKKSADVSLFYLSYNEAVILLNGTNNKGYTLNIFDVSGRQVSSERIEAGKNTYPVYTDSFLKGVYLFNVVSADNVNSKTFKYIK